MAKAAWCNVSPISGDENGNIAISAAAHTGRDARSTSVTVQNQSGTKPSKIISVSQAGAAISLTKTTAGADFPLPQAGGKVVIAGKSNGKYLGIMSGTGGNSILYPTQFLALKINGVAMELVKTESSAKVYTVTGDPGALAEYTYEWTITQPANTSAKVRVLNLNVRGAETPLGDSAVNAPFTITVAAAASALSVNPESLPLVTAGTAKNVAVTSNDNWTVV